MRRSILFVCAVLASTVVRAEEDVSGLLRSAREAAARRDLARAVQLATKAIEADPRNAEAHNLRGQLHAVLGKPDRAIADFDQCLKLDPQFADAYNHRGSEQFKRGKIAESVKDFDRYLELRPQQKPGHWKRGISLYYLGKFDEGRKQFESYEQVDTNDVENAVWHFLCTARKDGLAGAREKILKIGKDSRVPMMEVYALFQGKLEPKDVLAAAQEGKLTEEERKQQLFYAHLYLGLYHEVTGDKAKTLEHIRAAATTYRIGHYMGDVARVHADLLRRTKQGN